MISMDTMRAQQPEAFMYRVVTDRGEHELRIAVPGNSPGMLCVRQVVVAQP